MSNPFAYEPVIPVRIALGRWDAYRPSLPLSEAVAWVGARSRLRSMIVPSRDSLPDEYGIDRNAAFTGTAPKKSARDLFEGQRPTMVQYVVEVDKPPVSVPLQTALNWIVRDQLVRLGVVGDTRSDYIPPLSRRSFQMPVIVPRVKVPPVLNWFAVDSHGVAVKVHNQVGRDGSRRIAQYLPKSDRSESLDRSQTWCSSLTRFEPFWAEMIVDRSISWGYDGKGSFRRLPHDLPWEVFSARDYEEIRKITRIRANRNDMRRTYKTASNVWEDAAQDASIRFAELLRRSAEWPVMYRSAEGWPVAFWYEGIVQNDVVEVVFDESGPDAGNVDSPAASSHPVPADQDAESDNSDDETEWDEEDVPGVPDVPPTTGFMVTRWTLYAWSVKTALKRYNLGEMEETTSLSVDGSFVKESDETARIRTEPWNWDISGPSVQRAPEYHKTAYKRTSAVDPVITYIWHDVWQNGLNFPILSRLLAEYDKAPGTGKADKARFWVNATKTSLNQDKVTQKDRSTVRGHASDEWKQLRTDLEQERRSRASVPEVVQSHSNDLFEE